VLDPANVIQIEDQEDLKHKSEDEPDDPDVPGDVIPLQVYKDAETTTVYGMFTVQEGYTAVTDGKLIRLVVPELNEERRKELTKVVRKGAEEAKVAMRNTRRDAMEQIKKLKKDSKITEDDQRKAEDELQKLTDAQIKEVDKVAAEKEKEIMEV
jgi:ribosome recycling factor